MRISILRAVLATLDFKLLSYPPLNRKHLDDVFLAS